MTHYVNPKPFNPLEKKKCTAQEEALAKATPMWLMWKRFCQHRLALLSLFFLIFMYLIVLFAEIFAPYDPTYIHGRFSKAPPQSIRWSFQKKDFGPYTYTYNPLRNMVKMRWEYHEDKKKPQTIRFLCTQNDYAGSSYQFWGLFKGSFHLFCPAKNGQLFLLGTDRLGRDMLSRIIYGARISLTIGIVGITISMSLGMLLGGLAGFYGGWIDSVVQRIIEIIRSFPHLPLWMALSAALPEKWGPGYVFLGLTVILALLDWPSLARAVRAKLLSLREEDFAVAAALVGATPKRIIARHLMPSFTSHLIASASLAIPSMILGETALSFLGLGLRPPAISWGILLNNAQNAETIVIYPWLIAPIVPVILVVLAFNFLGDGLRDATDPYKA